MKNKRKKILVTSVLVIVLLFVVVLFKSRPFSYPNVKNNQDYRSRQESNFTTGGKFSNGNYNTLSLDVEKCYYGKDSVGFGFGHTEFAIEGRVDNNCVFSHGTEIENPMWDGSLDTNCKIPMNTSVNLTVTDSGIDFSSIEKYCSSI